MLACNYWDEFEYNKLKLLCHEDKVKSITEVGQHIRRYDNLPPISVEFHLTNNCNLACPWCTDRSLHGNGACLTLEKSMELLRYFGKTGTGVTLEGGGEPTVHPKFQEIVAYGYENEVDMGLITNGTVDIGKSINKLKWVRVSLDAGTKEEYTREKGRDLFDRVLGNLKKYAEIRDTKHCFLGIGYVLTKRNMGHIQEIVKVLDDLNVDYIYLRPVEEAADIMPERNKLYDLRKELLDLTGNRRIKFNLLINDRLEYNNANLPCICHSLTSIIHADGDVACCEKRRHDPIVLGNVYEQSFQEIWNSEKRIRITERLLDSARQEGCSVCRITPFNKIFANLERVNTKRFI